MEWLRTIVTRTAQDRLREDARHDRQRLEIVGSIDKLPLGEDNREDNRVSIVDTASVDAYRRARHVEAHLARVAVIKRLIRLLPQFEDRQVMALRYYDEFNYLKHEEIARPLKHKEIARITGKTVKSVKHRIARATNLLNAVATQLNALLNILSNEEARMMRRYLFDRASDMEIAELLDISPDAVVERLVAVMTRWKKFIAQQKRTEPVTTRISRGGEININYQLIFVKKGNARFGLYRVTVAYRFHLKKEGEYYIMFLQQTMNPWFAVQRASQVTMILLAATMLVLPILHYPEESIALEPLTTTAILGIVGLGGILLAWKLNDCDNCSKNGVGDAHYVKCPKEHWYYNCDSSSVWFHQPCYSSS